MKASKITRKNSAELVDVGGASSGFRSDRSINLMVNGQLYALKVGNHRGEIDPSDTVAHTLRETLGLTGTKVGCNHGACGACTVLMDGEPILSCLTLTIECDEKSITTIEGLEDPITGKHTHFNKVSSTIQPFSADFAHQA